MCLLRVHLRVRARCLRAPVHTAMTRYDEVLIQNATDHVCRLDSRGAKNLMRVLRRVAASGRTIICSIHQPSGEVFGMFDEVVLLHGGELVYSGDLGPPRYPLHACVRAVLPGPASPPADPIPRAKKRDGFLGVA